MCAPRRRCFMKGWLHMMDERMIDRVRGCAVGAAVGDALGMPLEFAPARPLNDLVRQMLPGREPAGCFTDDTEMALALAESLLALRPLNPDDLARRFAAWYRSNPPDIGIHTANVLRRISLGQGWNDAAAEQQRLNPASASNGSLMRCWPVALAWWNNLDWLVVDSALQSRVTHQNAECVAACVFINKMIAALIAGEEPGFALGCLLEENKLPDGLRAAIAAAPGRQRADLPNSGWVRHTVESAIWGLFNAQSFEETVVKVANLGSDADTAASVAGALAGAYYGLEAIPLDWRAALHGEYPLDSGQVWLEGNFIALADQLAGVNSD